MYAVFLNILLISISVGSIVHASNGAVDPIANETRSQDRQARVSGRIVKLYSGSQPEPIYCDQEGFKADPVHCTTFYRCVKGASGRYTVFKFQCGPGTVYDPEVETCTFPQSSKRLECGGSNRVNYEAPAHSVVHPEISLTPPELPSPIVSENTYSEQKDFTTAYPWASSKPPASSSYNWNSERQKSEEKHTSKRPDNSDNIKTGDKCTTDGFMGDSEDCQKFYRCVGNQRGGFTRYEFSCSGSTIWDEDVQTCNNPGFVQRSRCNINSSRKDKNNQISNNAFKQQTQDREPHNTIQEQLQINYGDKVSQTQTQINHGQATQNQTQINYGNRDSGKKSQVKQNQTQISYGSAVSQTQTQINHGKDIVQTQLQIDHSKDSSQAQTTATSNNNENNEEQDQGEGNQNNEHISNKPSTTENNGNVCEESGFMGDKNDCNKFFRCVDNGRGGFIKYEFMCGAGTVWDSSIESCNHAWAVKSCGTKDPQNSPQQVTQTTKKPNEVTQSGIESSTDDIDSDTGYNQQDVSTTSPTSTTTKLPTESSGTSSDTNNECKSSGFMGDKHDCKKFYRCVDNSNGGYTRYEFSCGEGTVWDPKIETCNHAWAVEKCGEDDSDVYKETTSSTGSSAPILQDENIETTKKPDNGYTDSVSESTETSKATSKPELTQQPITNKPESSECTQEGFMGDKNDCKKFYRCVDNGRGGFIKYEFTCGDGTVWDPEINTCNHEDNGKQSCNTNSAETSTQVENTSSTTEKTDVSETPHSTTETSSISEPSSANKKCTKEGFMKDDNDCKKFYRCVDNGKGGYIQYEFTCGDGTIWDQDVQTCNHDSNNSTCSRTDQASSTTTSHYSEGTTEHSSSTESQMVTKEPTSDSSDICTGDGFYANSNDCRKFYRCVDNGKGGYTKYDFSCGEGTVWVQEIQACDHNNGDICSSAQTEAPQSEIPQSQTSKPDQSTSSSTTENSNSMPDKQEDETSDGTSDSMQSNESEDKCTSEGFHPNQSDCRKFYRCVDNGNGGYTKYDFSCGEGTAWDSNLQTCNHINEVENCKEHDSQHETAQDEGSTETSDNSSQSSSTTESTNSKPPSKNTCENEGYFGDSEDCTKFYRCVDNGKGGFTKYDFTCGEGTIWDQDVTSCNHPRDVVNPSCKQSTDGDNSDNNSSTSSSTTSSATTSSTSSRPESTSDSNASAGSDCSTKKPGNKNVNCTEAGYYPDPDDCKKFYRCVDWDGNGEKFSVYFFECGEGTIWDPALDTCNHEESVYPPRDCSGSQTQTGQETNSETTTAETSTDQQTTEKTTTEQTTTQVSTTNEQTTTSNEESTTHQPTEKTTTTQSPEQQTTEQTTTEQTTTGNEQTTAQQTTEQTTQTTEQTTTESTTSSNQQTTAQQTTEQTTEQTTTQQTSEQTTTQQTTEQSTTQEATTHESTTHSTTDQTTTEGESTSSQSNEGTTQESTTTEVSTTSQSSESSTTESSQESTTMSNTEQTTENSAQKECPETEEDQNMFVCPTSFRRHPKYCNMFYQCTEDDDTHDVQIATFNCPNNTIYDESQTKCVEEKKAEKKCDGEIAQRRRVKRFNMAVKEPIIMTTERLKCPAHGHYPLKNGECSPAFLKCEKTKLGTVRGYVYQCPQNYVYWSVSRRCEPEGNLRDCTKSHNDWRGRWEIPIERRNVAP